MPSLSALMRSPGSHDAASKCYWANWAGIGAAFQMQLMQPLGSASVQATMRAQANDVVVGSVKAIAGQKRSSSKRVMPLVIPRRIWESNTGASVLDAGPRGLRW